MKFAMALTLAVPAISFAEANRYHGCFAMALCTTRLNVEFTDGFNSETGVGMCFRMADATSDAPPRSNGWRAVNVS